MVYNKFCRGISDVKGKTENSVKAGRLCHHRTDFHKSGREVVVMIKYIIRIFVLVIVFLLTLIIKVR
mgnify:CR=1